MKRVYIVAVFFVTLGLFWMLPEHAPVAASTVVAVPPECTATQAGIEFVGPLSQVIIGSGTKTLTSTFTITASQDSLPASVIVNVAVYKNVIYTNGLPSSSTRPVLHQTIGDKTTISIPTDFSVPLDAQSVTVGIVGELSCNKQVLAREEQVFRWWKETTFLPLVGR